MEKTAEVEVPEPEYLPKDRYGGANFYAAKKTVAQINYGRRKFYHRNKSHKAADDKRITSRIFLAAFKGILVQIISGMMDVALITANANQLRFILEYNQTSPSFNIAIALIIISLILQVVVGICLIFKGRCDLKGDKKFKEANTMNNYIVVGVFIITIVNVFVAAFSTGPPPLPKAPENI